MKKSSALSRILAFALVVCMCAAFCATPMVTSAEGPTATIAITPTSGTAPTITSDGVPVAVGNGTIAYDAATQTITLNNASAKKIDIRGVQGNNIPQLTIVVNGENTFDNVSGGNANAVYARFIDKVVFTGTGTLTAKAKTNTLFGSTDVTFEFDGPDVIITDTQWNSNNNASINANKGIIVRSGSITTTSTVGSMTAGTSIDIYGGTLNLTGGTSNANSHCLKATGDINIYGGEITFNDNAKGTLLSSGNINITGGEFVGVGKTLFNFGAAGKTVTIGADAKIDYTAATGIFGTNCTAENIVADGVEFAEGCNPLEDETLTLRTVVGEITGNATINATATLNGANMADVTIGLYDAENALVESAVTDANGKVTFILKDLPVGEYAYTLKQTVVDNGFVYAADIPVSVAVDSVGNVIVTENLVFANTYDAEVGYISVTLADGSVATFTDISGDETATSFVEGIAFDADTNVVTLNNVVGISRIVFALAADFTVELNGANIISTVADDANKYAFESSTAGVNMTVVGGEDDSLTITTPTGALIADDKYQKQINVNGNLTLDGGTYTVIGHNYTVYATGDILVKDAVLDIVGQSRTLNAVGKLTLTNSTVTSAVDSTARWQLAFDNGGFEMTNSHIVTNAGGYTLAGAGDITLNSGSITSQDKVFIQTRGTSDVPVTITVGTDMVLDVTCETAAVSPKAGTSPEVTILDEGVVYEEGKEFTAAATAVKTSDAPAVSANATISATVTLNDKADAGRVVELWNAEGKITEAIADEAGVVTFTVSELAAGEYTYILKVVGENGNGYTYAEDATVTVTVVDNDNVTVTSDIVLANTYDAEDTSATIEATVTLDGREIGYEEFYLILNGDTLAGPLTALVGTDGKASFEIAYDAEGTYTYVLSQQAVTLGGVTVDTETTYEITVTVVDNNGALEATVSEGTYTFANTYAVAEKEANINVNVTLADNTLKEGDFTFILSDENGEEVARATNDAAGNVLFNIKYNTVGTKVYTYTLTQLDSEIAGVTEDPTAYTITVTVTDNGAGTLTVEVDPANVTFANTYKIPFVEGSIEEIDGELYYVSKDGVPTTVAMFQVGDDYYCAEAGGKLVVNRSFYIWRSNDQYAFADGWYYFGEDGKLLQGICENPEDESGKLYYFVNGQPQSIGMFQFEGAYYNTVAGGSIVTSNYNATDADGKFYVYKIHSSAEGMTEGWYYFGEDGKLLQGIQESNVDGKLYYYVDGKRQSIGMFKLDGVYYNTVAGGSLVTSNYNATNADGMFYVYKIHSSAEGMTEGWYYFGEDGKLLQGIQKSNVDGKLYYYVDGKRQSIGLFKLNGVYYNSVAGGSLVTTSTHENGKFYVYKIHPSAEGMTEGWYYFDAEGKMLWQNDKVYTMTIDGAPAEYEKLTYGTWDFDGITYKAFTDEIVTKGLVTLPVYVNNNTEDAVNARTFFLVEEAANNWVHCVENLDVGNTQWVKEGGSDMVIYIDGVKYAVGVYTYDAQLAAGETSAPSIYQWFMDKNTGAGVAGLEDGVQIKFVSEISAEELDPVTSEYVASLFGGSVQ